VPRAFRRAMSAPPVSPAPMRVLERAVYRGPSLFSRLSMIRIQLDLGTFANRPTSTLPGFAEALLARLPGLAAHGCSYAVPGGFARRLRDGTWLGHVAEHVALELQVQGGHGVTRGKTRAVRRQPGVYNILYAYEDKGVGLAAGLAALALVAALLPREHAAIEHLDRIAPHTSGDGPAHVGRVARRASLGPSTAALVAEARRRRIPVQRLNDASLIRLGHGHHQQIIRASVTGRTGLIATEIAANKDLARRLLAAGGVPVPRGTAVRTADEAAAAARTLRWPLVVKPLDSNHGRGVTLGCATESEVRAAFEIAAPHGRRVIVEELLRGCDHRILVVNGAVVAVAQRVPAHVVGDGTASIAALIRATNADPRRGAGHRAVLTRIVIDDALQVHLARHGLTLDSIAEADRIVELRATANLSTGGTAIDRTDAIHPANAAIARRAAAIVGLDIAGIDFITPDIANPVRETGGGIVEINAAPGLRMHLAPGEGIPRNVAEPIIRMLFPGRATGRIPVIAITGTNGKSTTGRMVKHILRQAGQCVGLTNTSGVLIDEQLVHTGDATGPKSARLVLGDPTVEVAVLETARGGMLREGLGFDRADIGCVLNVSPDHLGQGGVETLRDLARLKSLVVQVMHRRGTSVLNFDDPRTRAMARRAGGKVAWFSMHGGAEMSPVLAAHIAGGAAATVCEPGPRGGQIMLYGPGGRERLMAAAAFNTANALAAIAIARAHGVPPAKIRLALSGFHSSFDANPGRLNIADVGGVRIILDYAHNPASMAALADLVTRLRPAHRRTLGLVCVPGDRRDEDIRAFIAAAAATAAAAPAFDRLYLRAEPGLRGRARGAMLALQREAALAAGVAPENTVAHIHERDAIAAVLSEAAPGDLAVLTVTDIAGSWAQVNAFTPHRDLA